MDPDSRLSLIIVVLLFIASAWCALTETAIASVSRNRMKVAQDRGDPRARRVMYVLDHFDNAITTLLILTNIAHIAAASLVTVVVVRKWGLSAVTLSTAAVTLLMFFVGEMLPKSIGKKTAEKSSLASAGILSFFMGVLKPLTFLLTSISSLVMKAGTGEEEATVTEDELYDIIEDMAEEGDISDEQSELISSALQFSDVTAASILTPRVDVEGLDVNAAPEDALAFIRSQNHSRIPVYEDSIDNVVGVLQIRKYLKAYIKNHEYPDIRMLLDDVYYTHQNIPVNELLLNMSARKLNMAVISDAYGGTLGVVTVEDILEEIVGEIWDEDDEIHEPLVQLSNDVFLSEGDETVQDVFDFMEYEDPEEEENEDRFTNLLMADWAMQQFAEVPEKGASFTYHDLLITIAEVDHNRILSLSVERLPEETEEEVPAEETSGKEKSSWEAPGKEKSDKDVPGKEKAGKEASGKEISGKEEEETL